MASNSSRDDARQMLGEVEHLELAECANRYMLVAEGFCPRTLVRLNPQGECPCNTKWKVEGDAKGVSLIRTLADGTHYSREFMPRKIFEQAFRNRFQ